MYEHTCILCKYTLFGNKTKESMIIFIKKEYICLVNNGKG